MAGKLLLTICTLTLSACCHDTVRVVGFPSPPPELMVPSKAQYLLPLELRKTQPIPSSNSTDSKTGSKPN